MFLETIKILDTLAYNLEYHELRSGIKDIKRYINPPKKGLYRCRLVYDKNAIIKITYYPYKKRDIKTLKLLKSDIIYDKKSINRQPIEKLFALRGMCDDILIVKNDLITDTSIANIALYKDGTWFTPKTPLLHGTTRQRYIDKGLLIQKDITVDSLYNYSKVALLNAMIDFDIIADNNNIEEIIKC
jgi:4-amino-4-deoxychorismate lyase